ncbi:uncharacterized protein si:ch1073-59l16.1 [Pseudorasbora parva]|uniref:uncharacterized protein si:ch1073-59l16.1 n=1 Tax=Pseudorasbora parva TaxID=51549 RepID=UPI00351EEFDB
MDDVQELAVSWCDFPVPSGFDKYAKFILEITAGPPRLSVTRQDVSSSENARVAVTCHHPPQKELRWCEFGGCCRILDGASVEVRNEREHISVSMSGLKMENMGCCSSHKLQMPGHITAHPHNQTLVTAEARTRAGIFFLLPVILEILLIIIIYFALKLRTLCIERRLSSPAEECVYVTMHRKRSERLYGSTAGDGAYEVMADLKTNTPQREPDYENIRRMCESYL